MATHDTRSASDIMSGIPVAEHTAENYYIHQLCPEADSLKLPLPLKKKGLRVNIAALGDVGSTLLLGLKLLGGEILDTIGIYDLNESILMRYEAEMNQIGWPFSTKALPDVAITSEAELFDCDMFIFCASKAVPPVGVGGDVRMMQFEANRKIEAHYASLAKSAAFKGIFAVVSDPVDPLCKEALLVSGLSPGQIRGYGLGVMNKRAEYFAKKDPALASYLTEGRAFGPHGGDLVIANSLKHYDDELSRKLTQQTITANLQIREMGFKPYLAPALSSGAVSLLLTLSGQWNYSSVYLGRGKQGAFLGIRNRICGDMPEYEDLLLPAPLFKRIELAYRNLCELL